MLDNVDNASRLPELPPLIVDQAVFSKGLLEAEMPTPADVVGPAKGKKANKRYNVYRNNVIVGLTESLMAAYPVVNELVGEEFFRAMTPVYVRHTPPICAMLAEYGKDYPDFLQDFEPVQDVPYLPDIARLEQAWLQSYHSADATPMEPVALQTVPQERLGDVVFKFHPACRLVKSDYPIHSIWAAHKTDDPGTHMADIMVKPENVLITRPALDITVIALPEGGGAFIEALMSGHSLSVAAEHASETNENFDLAQNLGGLLETGALHSLELAS